MLKSLMCSKMEHIKSFESRLKVQLKIFTLRYSEKIDGFDDSGVREFMVNINVISCHNHFFIKDEIPYLMIVLLYNFAWVKPDPEAVNTKKDKTKKFEYMKLLNEENTPYFNMLREWRTQRAAKDKVPPYVIFKNMDLAGIVVKKPQSLNQLNEIEGVGKAKIEKYGKEIIGIITAKGPLPATKSQNPPVQTHLDEINKLEKDKKIMESMLYSTDKVKIEIFFHEGNVWLSQKHIAELLGVQRPAITKHLGNIIKEDDLPEETISFIREDTAENGKTYKTKYYNLDAVISIGYRINSLQTTKFRIWAAERLKEYLHG